MNMGHKPVLPPTILSQSSHCLHLLLLFLLLASSGLSYEVGDFRQCRVAPFVPGYTLLGESLDLATFERKGVHPIDIFTAMSRRRTCFLYRNPHQGNQLQKVPISAHLWTPESHCKTQVRTNGHSSVSSLIRTVKSQDIYDWKVGLQWKMFGVNVGEEYSESYDFAKSRNIEDQYTFSSHWFRCSFYKHTVSTKPRLNKHFEHDVKNLPGYYNSGTKDKYRNFIRTYGTHYIHQVFLGGQIKRIAATRTCLSKLNKLSTSESQKCLSLDLKAGLGLIKLKTPCHNFMHNSGMKAYYTAGLYEAETEVMGGNGWNAGVSSEHTDSEGFRQWMESLKHIPVIVKFPIRPLYELVNDEAKSALRDAINDYINDMDITVLVRKRSCTLSSHFADCCPKELGRGWLTVTIIRAWDLKGDYFGDTEGYVETSYGHQFYRTHVIESNNPWWNKKYNLGWVVAGQILKLEVKDADVFQDDLLLSCTYYVKAGSYTVTCKGDLGNFEGEYELFCGPHLTGNNCDMYEPY